MSVWRPPAPPSFLALASWATSPACSQNSNFQTLPSMSSSSSSSASTAAATGDVASVTASERARRKENRKLPGAIKRIGQRIGHLTNATRNAKDLDRNFLHYPRYVPAPQLARARKHCKALPVQTLDMQKAKEECRRTGRGSSSSQKWPTSLCSLATRVGRGTRARSFRRAADKVAKA